jgi:hypothetical protein
LYRVLVEKKAWIVGFGSAEQSGMMMMILMMCCLLLTPAIVSWVCCCCFRHLQSAQKMLDRIYATSSKPILFWSTWQNVPLLVEHEVRFLLLKIISPRCFFVIAAG